MTRASFFSDIPLVFSVILLSMVSLLVLYGFGTGPSSDFFSSIFFRQSLFLAFGFLILLFISKVDYQLFRTRSTVLYFGVAVIMVTLLFLGSTIRGTSGWLEFGMVRFQPVEVAKIALIIFLASFIMQKKPHLNEFTRLFSSLVFSGILIGLVLLQPDFGSAMVLLSIWVGMTFAGGIRTKFIFAIILFGTIISVSGWFLLENYQRDRIIAVLYPERDAKGSGYNSLQSMIAVGSGGLSGKGIGQGTQSQLNFLPEKHTDFIFAASAESLGLIGSLFILGIYAFFLYRVRTIALMASDNFGYLVAVGIFVLFFVQMFVNVGMNVGVFPITGIPLPFLSYGGSSFVSSCIAVGILLNIAERSRRSLRVGSYDYQ